MDDPIEKMRKAQEDAQTMARLTTFAQHSEDARVEKDWREFISRTVLPAFAKVKSEFFKENFLELPEEDSEPGFKVRLARNLEFWFWIKLRNGLPEPQARLKNLNSSGATVIATQFYGPKAHCEIADVSEEDVVRAISEAYTRSLKQTQ